jgi:hypothetical protein
VITRWIRRRGSPTLARMSVRWSVALAVLALVGCARETGFASGGEPCVRSTECQAGLACVAGQCTTDLSGLEGGTLPPHPMDAGPGIDSGPGMDAGPGVDAGPGIDAGPGMDAGPPPRDSGPPPRDSGPPPVDSGPPPVDSGPPPVDSGPPPMPDSGPPPLPDSGPVADGG